MYERDAAYEPYNKRYSRRYSENEAYQAEEADPDGCSQCLTYLLFIFNIVFLIAGVAICGGSVFILIEKTFVSDVMNNNLLTIACWLVIIGSGVTIFISITGCCGAAKHNRTMLFAYGGILIGLVVILMGGGIMALALQGEIGEWVIAGMEDVLKDDYGVNLDNKYNQIITQAWDKGQTEMYCCAVRDNSWGVYRQSLWYASQPGIETVDKPYVPPSCCKMDITEEYLDLTLCQTNSLGPPGIQSGPYNQALHYRGCYTAGEEWIDYYSSWLAGLGIGLAVLLGLGIFSSFWLAIRLRKR